MSLDIDRYFERIGWGGDTRPTLDTITGLLKAHMSSIPFENLDVLLHRPVRLDLDAIEAKLVVARRGGYCFEHTTLFAAVLSRLGFDNTLHSARVVLFTPRTQSERAHMFSHDEARGGDVRRRPGFRGTGSAVPHSAARTRGLARSRTRRIGWSATATVGASQQSGRWRRRGCLGFHAGGGLSGRFRDGEPLHGEPSRLSLRQCPDDGSVHAGRAGHADEPQLHDPKKRHGFVRPAGRPCTALRAFVSQHFGFDLPDIERLRVPAIPEWD